MARSETGLFKKIIFITRAFTEKVNHSCRRLHVCLCFLKKTSCIKEWIHLQQVFPTFLLAKSNGKKYGNLAFIMGIYQCRKMKKSIDGDCKVFTSQGAFSVAVKSLRSVCKVAHLLCQHTCLSGDPPKTRNVILSASHINVSPFQ